MEENMQPPVETTTRNILVFGNHDYILHNVETLLNRAGYKTAGYINLEEALDHIRYNPLDGILIGGGVDPHFRLKIKDLVGKDFPHVRIIEHFGGPATILTEVNNAFKS